MTKEREQAEKETARIVEAVRSTDCEDKLLIAAMSYAKGLVEGKRIALSEGSKDAAALPTFESLF